MSVEPYKNATHLPTQSEVSRQSDVVHLTGNPMVQKQVPQIKSDPESPSINLSEYQKQLLDEIKRRPDVMNLFRQIFQQYPQVVAREYRLTSPHATKRQNLNGRKATLERLQLEADIEEQICKLSGIDINQIKADNTESVEKTQEEVEEAVIEEEVTPVDIKEEPVKKTKKKSTKKKSSKKKTTKKDS